MWGQLLLATTAASVSADNDLDGTKMSVNADWLEQHNNPSEQKRADYPFSSSGILF